MAQQVDPQALLNDKDELRRRATDAYMGVGQQMRGQDAALTASGTAAVDAAEKQGQAAIGRGSAQALASTQGGGGFGRGGVAAASQIGADAGYNRGRLAVDIAQQRQGIEQESAQRKIDATGADIQGFEAVGSMGTNAEDEAAQRADVDARINGIIKANKGFFNDDEDTAVRQIQNLITPSMSKANQDYIRMRMKAISGGAEDI